MSWAQMSSSNIWLSQKCNISENMFPTERIFKVFLQKRKKGIDDGECTQFRQRFIYLNYLSSLLEPFNNILCG